MAVQRRSVVVADDDPEIRQMIGEYLSGSGFHVFEAENGLDTLLQVKRTRPAGVVLDIHMPRLGGVEALKRIRTLDPSIVVAVVTGDADVELHRRVVELGAAAVFLKPAPLHALGAVLALGAGPRGSEARERPPIAPPTEAPVDRVSVLVIDDDEGVRELLSEYLTGSGYDVRSAADTATGLRHVMSSAPDIILLDIELPGLNGVKALPAFQALAPGTSIVMVSGTADADLAAQALAHGAFDYVTKPIDFSYLAAALETAVAMRRVQA